MLEEQDSIRDQQDSPHLQQLDRAKDPQSVEELLRTYKFDDLDSWSIYAYGVGHFLNDLTASFWFNFSLFFLVTIAKTEAAAVTFLTGQVVDSICTPLVGYLSDKHSSRYGQRTPWFIAGYFIVLGSFPFIFRVVHYGRIWELVYYPFFAGLFNVGWAFCQISHMSLVPSVSCSKTRRNKLNNIRNTSSFVANFILLTLASLFLYTNGSHQGYFFVIGLILLVIGSLTTFFFLYHFRQPKLTAKCAAYRQQLESISNKSQALMLQDQEEFRWYHWFKKSTFYFYGFAYVTARLSINVMITMLPFYVKRIENSTDHDITMSLLILYLASILVSTKTKDILNAVGGQWILLLGFLLSILASGILEGASNSNQQKMFLFLATGVIGAAQAIILNSVLNFICDIIGSNGAKGGFVFGAYSFMDKISTGIVVYVVSMNGTNLSNASFVKLLVLLLPPSLSFFSCLMVCFAVPNSKKSNEEALPKSLLQKELT